jgi:hypothetical protein
MLLENVYTREEGNIQLHKNGKRGGEPFTKTQMTWWFCSWLLAFAYFSLHNLHILHLRKIIHIADRWSTDNLDIFICICCIQREEGRENENEKKKEKHNVIVKLWWFVNLMIWNLLFTLICLWRWLIRWLKICLARANFFQLWWFKNDDKKKREERRKKTENYFLVERSFQLGRGENEIFLSSPNNTRRLTSWDFR